MRAAPRQRGGEVIIDQTANEGSCQLIRTGKILIGEEAHFTASWVALSYNYHKMYVQWPYRIPPPPPPHQDARVFAPATRENKAHIYANYFVLIYTLMLITLLASRCLRFHFFFLSNSWENCLRAKWMLAQLKMLRNCAALRLNYKQHLLIVASVPTFICISARNILHIYTSRETLSPWRAASSLHITHKSWESRKLITAESAGRRESTAHKKKKRLKRCLGSRPRPAYGKDQKINIYITFENVICEKLSFFFFFLNKMRCNGTRRDVTYTKGNNKPNFNDVHIIAGAAIWALKELSWLYMCADARAMRFVDRFLPQCIYALHKVPQRCIVRADGCGAYSGRFINYFRKKGGKVFPITVFCEGLPRATRQGVPS